MSDKKWYFDSGNPSVVPQELTPVLAEKGIPEDHIKICVKSDLNRDMVRSDCYLLCTDSDLIVLSGSVTLTRGKNSTPFTRHKLDRKFEILSWNVYDLAELSDFRVEEQIASARLTAKKKDGGYELLTNLSNTYKDQTFFPYY